MSVEFALCEDFDKSKVPKNAVIEVKEDGGRFYFDQNGDLWTRDGYRANHRYPDVVPFLPSNCILDMEICVFDFSKQPRLSKFEDGFQKRCMHNNPKKAELASLKYPCTAYVFDCLNLKGKDLTKEPLSVRRKYLEQIGNIKDPQGYPRVIIAEQYPISMFSQLQKLVTRYKLEGLVVKDLDAPYVAKRTSAMMKYKQWTVEDFPILRQEITENEGFVIYINLGTKTKPAEQRVVINSAELQRKVKDGAKIASVGFLNRMMSNQLRQPHIRAIV